MKRDLNKAVLTYKSKYEKNDGIEGAFYASDIYQIRDMSMKNGKVDYVEAIMNALDAGFMIGYRKAMRDARQKRGRC